MQAISQRGAAFLMRLPESAVSYARKVGALAPDDARVQFHPTAPSRHKDPQLPETLTARLIRYQIQGFRPSHLLTSLLDAQAFPAAELVDLYHRRWQIETVYREWKHALDIQNLRSHTPAGILKETYAQLLLSNLVRWVMVEAVQDTELHATDLSYLCALTAVQNALLRMLRAGPRHIRIIYQQLLEAVRSARIRKRPGRSYPRPDDTPQNKGHGKLSRPARLTEP
jgi:hypothetical protein